MTDKIALAPNGIFKTIQGEGALLGVPMLFVRFAGCSVNCDGCDTDYSVGSRLTPDQVQEKLRLNLYGAAEWLWITGGEPRLEDAMLLSRIGRGLGLKVALATAGTWEVPGGAFDFVSVSPHATDASWVQRHGDQVVCVPGLHRLTFETMAAMDVSGFAPGRRYVSPMMDRENRPADLQRCVDFVMARKGWCLNVQAHKFFYLP